MPTKMSDERRYKSELKFKILELLSINENQPAGYQILTQCHITLSFKFFYRSALSLLPASFYDSWK
jgi:hypothetical protein